MEDEEQAIARLKQGDLQGLEALVERYQALAVHTAYLIVGERALAEDIAQAAFLKAAGSIGAFDAARPFKPWFLRMVVNDSLKATRQAHRSCSLDATSEALVAWVTDPSPGPAEAVQSGELQQTVWNALRQLTPQQRAVIVQRHFLEMDEAEMVRELRRPASTVKWWLHTARERLKTLLRPEQPNPPAPAMGARGEPGRKE